MLFPEKHSLLWFVEIHSRMPMNAIAKRRVHYTLQPVDSSKAEGELPMSCYRMVYGLALVASLMAGNSLLAADLNEAAPLNPVPPAETGDWSFSIAPYFWAASIDGKVGVADREPVDINVPFRDLFDHLRFGGMVVGEAQNGTWGVFGDLIYLKLEADRSLSRTVAGIPLDLSAELETSSLVGTLMGEYRVISQPTATMDIMAGARVWNVENQLNVSLSTGGSPLAAFSGNDTKTWVDPMIGAKGRIDLSPSWYLTGWAMVGGFGAASDFAWDVLAGVGYQWNQSFSAVGGYRALGVNYSSDGFTFDVTEYGPILGIVVKF